jgi:glycosyltransferase involved in cell wall biosynthesis
VKILYLINTLSAGGAELHLLTLCRFLKKQNVEVVVACLREQVKDSRSLRPEFERENIRIINLQADNRYDFLFLGKIARVLSAERPDILHTHLPRADFAGAFAQIFYPDLVWISTVHDIYDQSWSGRWALPFLDFVWRRADRVVAISHAVENWLVDERSARNEKVRVIHYGIEPKKFSKSKVNLRDRWGLNDKAVIGSIGRLEPRKNHECLIAAMPQIWKAVPNAILLIAGHDPWEYGVTLRRQINELGLGEKVRLVGFQNDVASFFNALDVFAFATNSEGFGQVMVEAMAMSKPVVASAIPPLTEIAVDGDTGLLVERGNPRAFADALIQLIKDPLKRERMGLRGRKRVEKFFTAERMAGQTLALYEELERYNHEAKSRGLKSSQTAVC